MSSKKVVKSIVKSKVSEKTTASDGKLFEDSWSSAQTVHQSSTLSFRELLGHLKLEELKDMQHYVDHDKTNKDKKWAVLAERLVPYQKMLAVQNKLNTAMSTFKNLIIENLESECGDDEGVTLKKKVEQLLIATIAVEEAKPAGILVLAPAPVGLAALNSMSD